MDNTRERVIGGEIVAAMLAAEGVEKVFGIIDGTYLGFYASFEKYGIELVTPRHETTAAHMAGAYARLTGKLGVCMASNGPGVANVLPGVAVENAEGSRVLLITSSRRQGITYPDRGGAYQYFNQVGVIGAMSKASLAVPSFERIPEMMRKAFRESFAGRPGVVHVDIPENVFNGTFEVTAEAAASWKRSPQQYRRVAPIEAPAEQVREAAALLRNAERPALHVGGGVVHAGAFEELVVAAERLQAPVLSSWSGRPAVLDTHPLTVPMPYMQLGREVRTDADVILILGSRIGETDWWGKAPHWAKAGTKIIQVDVDESILGLNLPTDLPVLADAKSFLRALVQELDATPVADGVLKARKARIAALQEKKDAAKAELAMALENEGTPIHPAQVPTLCRAHFPDDAVVVVDGGNTAVWTSFFHTVTAPNTVLSTFEMGMLGAGVGQALGAKVARPEAPVYCILGDGAFGFHPQEIETAVRHGLAVTYVVLCDKQWGMVKLTQSLGLGGMRQVLGLKTEGTINADLEEIAFDKLAESMGAHGERVSSPDELKAALQRCTDLGKPAVIHVDVDPMQHMFAPGLQDFKEMHQEPQG